MVEGYVDVKGQVSDIAVELLPPTGYDDMVATSLEILEHWTVHEATSLCGHIDFECVPFDMLVQAMKELEQSWKARIQLVKQAAPKEPTDGLVRQEDGWYLKADDPTLTVLKEMRKISQESRTTTPEKAGKTEKWTKTRVKEKLTVNLPIGSYLGRLNLRPETISGLKVSASPL